MATIIGTVGKLPDRIIGKLPDRILTKAVTFHL